MIVLQNHIAIDKPVEEVYKFIKDFTNIPRWNYYVKSVTEITENESDHKMYHQVRKNDEQIFEVINSEFPELIEIETRNKRGMGFRRLFTFKKAGPGECVINDHFEIDLKIPAWVAGLAKSKIQKAVNDNLSKLKELLETGNTILQNGKLSSI